MSEWVVLKGGGVDSKHMFKRIRVFSYMEGILLFVVWSVRVAAPSGRWGGQCSAAAAAASRVAGCGRGRRQTSALRRQSLFRYLSADACTLGYELMGWDEPPRWISRKVGIKQPNKECKQHKQIIIRVHALFWTLPDALDRAGFQTSLYYLGFMQQRNRNSGHFWTL